MEVFAEYLAHIDHPQHRDRTEEVLSVAKHHLAVAPERAGINHFSNDIVQAGYDHTKELIRIKWDSPVDFSLLEKMIEFNIMDKSDCSTFWRK
jgi:uncharacterized protein YdhG (YjbR/CyaY superfamily)